MTPPGIITPINNQSFISFYLITRQRCIERTKLYNERNKEILSKMDNRLSDLIDSDSDCDDQRFIETEYQRKLYKCIKEDTKLNTALILPLKQCKICHSIKLPGTHHCSVCHRCVYGYDHHCIWVNNCVGQFNHKYFILFLIYLLLFSISGLFLNIKYIILKIGIKNYFKYKIIIIIQMIINLILNIFFIILSIFLLKDQISNLYENMLVFNNKNRKMIEIRAKMEMLIEIFGDEPSLSWLIPMFPGGFINLFNSQKKNN